MGIEEVTALLEQSSGTEPSLPELARIIEKLTFVEKVTVIRKLPQELQDEIVNALRVNGSVFACFCIDCIQMDYESLRANH